MTNQGTGLFTIPINDNTVYYVAKGTASNIEEKGTIFIDPAQLHEYPQQFVGKIHDVVNNAVLILFDPFTEDIPYIVYHNFNEPKKTSANIHNNGWIRINECVWQFDGDGKDIGRSEGIRYKITLYNYRLAVTFDGTKYSSELDLQNEFVEFARNLSQMNHTYLLYHDYSGRNPLYVNNIIKNKLNLSFMKRCLIDFSYGMDYGCLFVTNDPRYTLIFKKGKIFNPHGVGNKSVQFFKKDIYKYPGIISSIATKTYNKISKLHQFPRAIVSHGSDETKMKQKDSLIDQAFVLSEYDNDFKPIVELIIDDEIDELIKYIKKLIKYEASIFFDMIDTDLPDIVPDYTQPYEFISRIHEFFKVYMIEKKD